MSNDTVSDTVIGIDVSSKWLDIHVLPEGRAERIVNDPEGIASVVELSNELDVSLVVMASDPGPGVPCAWLLSGITRQSKRSMTD